MKTLYGRGAVVLSDDHSEYRAKNGVLLVPDHMVVRARAAGFTDHPLPELEPDTELGADLDGDVVAGLEAEFDWTNVPLARTAPVPPIDATKSDEDLLLQFSDEAVKSGYSEEGAASIAYGRLRHLRAGGDGYDVLAAPSAPAEPAEPSEASAPPAPTSAESPTPNAEPS
jgi:hypothetical protein